VLIRDKINRPEFSTWFRRYRPDVVIGHLTEVVAVDARLRGADSPNPRFFCFNLHLPHPPCAGLDFRPRLIGAHGAELVITQLLPKQARRAGPDFLHVPAGRWVDGPTLRPAPPTGRKSKIAGQPGQQNPDLGSAGLPACCMGQGATDLLSPELETDSPVAAVYDRRNQREEFAAGFGDPAL